MVEWAKDAAVQQVWADVARAHDITTSPFNSIDRTFGPADFALATSWAYSIRCAASPSSVICGRCQRRCIFSDLRTDALGVA